MRVLWVVWYKQEEATHDTNSGICSGVLKRPDHTRNFLSIGDGLKPGIFKVPRGAAAKNKQTGLKSTS